MKDEYRNIEGRVRAFWTDGDSMEPVIDRSNIITFNAADLMARMLAGDTSAIPNHIGFIYGTDASPAGGMDTPTSRDQSWSDITTDVLAASGNMLVCPMVTTPALSADNTPDVTYVSNKVTMTSHSGAYSAHAFTPGVSGFADAIGDIVGDVYFYHAVLLGVSGSGTSTVYTPFARVNLGAAPYTAKAENRELAVYWDIIFR